jgi:hypothetical protein
MKKRVIIEVSLTDNEGQLYLQLNEHTVTPSLASSVAYSIISKYMIGIPKEDRQDFLDETLENFAYLIEEHDGGILENVDEPSEE